MKKSITINAVLNTFQTVISIIFPLITYPYCSRVLGVEGIGKYGFSYSIVSYFVLLAGLGIKTYAIREGARCRDDRSKFDRFISEVFSINVYSMIISYALFALMILFSDRLKPYTILLVILSLQLFFLAIGKDYLYVINENYLYITIRQIAFHIVSLIFLFVFVRSSEDVPMYCFVSISGVVFSNIVNYFDGRKYARVKFVFAPSSIHIKPIILIFSTSIGIVIYASSDTTILGLFGNDYNVGIYNTSVKIYSTVKQVVAAVLTVTIPRFSNYLGTGNTKAYKKLFDDTFSVLLYIMIPAVVGMAVLSKELVLLIAGSDYISATVSLEILSFAMIFNLVSYMYGYCVLLPNRKDKEYMIATIVGAIVNIALNIVLIPLFFENAAAFTTVVAEFMVFVITIRYSKNIMKNNFRKKELLSIFVGCLWIAIICNIFKSIFSNYILVIIFSFIVSAIGYFSVTTLMGNKSSEYFVNIIKKKANS